MQSAPGGDVRTTENKRYNVEKKEERGMREREGKGGREREGERDSRSQSNGTCFLRRDRGRVESCSAYRYCDDNGPVCTL